MTSRIALFRTTHLRQTALALALGATAFAAHAATDDIWLTTRTQAAVSSTAPAVASTAAAISRTAPSAGSWSLRLQGRPVVLDASKVRPLEADKPLHVALSLNLRNEVALKDFLAEVNRPGSPEYHKYLTPAEFKARFSPTDAQAQVVAEHLRKYGFTNVVVAENNQLVSADGTAGAASAAFHTHLQHLDVNGEAHFANDEPARVPQSLANVVDAVLGLQDVAQAHTLHTRPEPIVDEVSLSRTASTARAAAQATVTSHATTEFPAIYNVGNVGAATNTTVAIIGWGSQAQPIADLKTFTTQSGLPTTNTREVHSDRGTYKDIPGDNVEWNLDSQTIVGTSGGVKQLIFYAGSTASLSNITAAYNRAVTDNLAKVINVSLGVDEKAAHQSGSQAADDRIFAQAAAQGQVFSVASGDAGAYQWSRDPQEGSPGYVADADGNVQIDLSQNSVSEPSTSPNVVAVGGTRLTTSGSAWAGEVTWNSGLSAVDPAHGDNNLRLWATGGGVSVYEDAPSWQSDALGGSVTQRQVPDIAFDADNASGAQIVLGGSTSRAANGATRVRVGGTSLASPIFVGIWARLASARANGLGLPTSNFYQHFSTDPSPLHDVTSGNNGYNGFGFQAGAGFDNVTGWGSLDIAKLNDYVNSNW
ncbi:MAG: Xanthomonalisin [Luteibacter sp.]|uniref:S53 family peptidase n=1 Tax=Luteibacter sp. TaxID=1886636 RepID=UPI00137D9BD0|nr:S53 family peptidase [Luteibacter sp.]KAF1005966.1 MAG: Xanthomonalisin [Luteibacter sp.]